MRRSPLSPSVNQIDLIETRNQLYNTALLSKVYEQKVAAGDMDAIAFIQGMSPVAWQHVNMFGSFEFSDESPDIDLEALAAKYADSDVWSNATQPGQADLFD